MVEGLGRYTLSCVLSYLTETEGTSFLITKKHFAYRVLPIFRLQPNYDNDNGAGVVITDGPSGSFSLQIKKNRHRFLVVPVQDATVLLARVNTRRLYQRHKRTNACACDDNSAGGRPYWPIMNCDTDQIAKLECQRHDPGAYLVPTKVPCLLRFLDPRTDHLYCSKKQGTTLLVSYPRSGNTLVRSLLERVTGIVTGSDTRPNRNLSRELAERYDLVGEGCVSFPPTKSLFVKTHWPERVGCTPFSAKRVILIVRNPYDAMDSYWNMNATCSHTKTVTDEVYERFHDFYQGLIRNDITIWMKFHQYWLEQQAQKQVPILIIRFEDLITQPGEQVRKMLAFSLVGTCRDSVLPAPWQERIDQVISASLDRLGSYQPRTTNGNAPASSSSSSCASDSRAIGKSIRKGRFSQELLDYIHDVAQSFPVNYLHHFGYDTKEQGFPDNFHMNNCNYGVWPALLRLRGQGEAQSNDDDWLAWPVVNAGTVVGSSKDQACAVRINEGNLVRPLDCTYGRKLTLWRHQHTDNDKNPLPIVE